MKQIKKLASLLLAAVLAMTLLAGCGGNVGTAVTEQSILKFINESRKVANVGLGSVENDPKLAQAAATLLEEFSKHPAKANYGTGYMLPKTEAENILNTATGKSGQKIRRYADSLNKSFFFLAPEGNYDYGYNSGLMDNNVYLLRRSDKVNDPKDDYYGYGYSYGYSNTIYQFGSADVVLANDMKVGIAFREINGERFALVVYDVTLN